MRYITIPLEDNEVGDFYRNSLNPETLEIVTQREEFQVYEAISTNNDTEISEEYLMSLPNIVLIDAEAISRLINQSPHAAVMPRIDIVVMEALSLQTDIHGVHNCIYSDLESVVEEGIREYYNLSYDASDGVADEFTTKYLSMSCVMLETLAEAVILFRRILMAKSIPVIDGCSVYELREVVGDTVVLEKSSKACIDAMYY